MLSNIEINNIKLNIKNKNYFLNYDDFTYLANHYLIIEKNINWNIDFTKQKYITKHMFSILLEWIYEVCDAYKIEVQTYYLTHQIISRYLTINTNIR